MGGSAYYWDTNLASLTMPCLVFVPNLANIEIDGMSLSVHSQLARIPISFDFRPSDIMSPPTAVSSFTHGGKTWGITAYLGRQVHHPQSTWTWTFRWSAAPPYYLPIEALASFFRTPITAACPPDMIMWIDNVGRWQGLPIEVTATALSSSPAVEEERSLSARGAQTLLQIQRTFADEFTATSHFSTGPLTSDDMRNATGLATSPYVYYVKSGERTPLFVKVSTNVTWRAGGRGGQISGTFQIQDYATEY